jgi:hypothetical protein
MTAPTLFNSSMSGFIQQESTRNYHRQLAEKKAYLAIATDAYQNALELVNQFSQKVMGAEGHLGTIENELSNTKDVSKVHQLESQKKQYERFTKTAPEKLVPITQRLEQLAENLQVLEDDITAIIEQARKVRNIASSRAG